MKKKANIYDADDVERSKRLNFTPEERAARAEHKAEVLGTKLEKAKKKVPKKKKLRLQKELDPEKSKLKHTLRFEEVEKKRGQEALPKKAGRRMVQSASCHRPLQDSSGGGRKRGYESRPSDRACV